MLKIRIIPILTFNGFALVKTKQFTTPRMVGNPVQAARVYNSRGVDELIFTDIFASSQNRKINLKVVGDVIKECYMPVGIGGGIRVLLQDINELLQIGADKVILKTIALKNPDFINSASSFFGSQCICISIDVHKVNNEYFVYNTLGMEIPLLPFLMTVQNQGAGEIVLNNVDYDGMMNGFDFDLYNLVHKNCNLPIVYVGGGGEPLHYQDLFLNTECSAVGSSSIFHFTQYTPMDVKISLRQIGCPVRL